MLKATAYDSLHKEWRQVIEIRWDLAGEIEEVELDTYCFFEADLHYLVLRFEDDENKAVIEVPL